MVDGIYTAVITPFNINKRVDYNALKKILNIQNDSCVDGVIILGSTAEEKSLNLSEKLKIIKVAVETIKNKKIYVGISCANLSTAKALIKKYEKFEFDGYLLGTPYYVKPTQDGLYKYFSNIAEFTGRNIILYNVPSRTAISISPQIIGQLSKIKNIVALKDATGNLEYTKTVLDMVDEEFTVLCGNDDMFLDMLKIGAVGCISVVSNIFPNYPCAVMKQYLCANHNSALRLFNKYLPFIKSLFLESNPICIKYAMNKVGECKNIMRLPLTEITDINKAIVDVELEKIIS